MTIEATLTSKGQTTIPKDVRDTLGIKPGDRLTFTVMPDSTVILRAKTGRLADLAGKLKKPGRKTVPVDQLSR